SSSSSSSSSRSTSHTSMVMDVKLPNRRGRPSVVAATALALRTPKAYHPGEVVQDLLNKVRDPGHKTHHIFAELDVLRQHDEVWEWAERSRWVKYEEDVEEGGDRWSKPHVASLSMQSLFNLRKRLVDGLVILDEDFYTLSDIKRGLCHQGLRAYVRDAAMLSHKHKHTSRKTHKKGLRTLSEIRENGGSSGNLKRTGSSSSFDSTGKSPSASDLQALGSDINPHKPNLHFMKKIPKDAQVAHLMVGAIDHLERTLVAFVRFKEPRDIGDISEVSFPSRFVFFCLGRSEDEYSENELIETGRCMGTVLVDEIFREVAYKANSRSDVVAGVDEFMEQVTVLPPGEWDPKIRIEPPSAVPSQDFRTSKQQQKPIMTHRPKLASAESHVDPTLVMSKIPFKGLYEDIKRKIPHYGTDFKDALHVQCLAAFVYVFLGTLTPNVTFGAVLGKATDDYMGVMECIFAAAVTGVIFALFSGQPLNILGSTGPMLVLEGIIYNLCKDNGWDYLPARVWVGMWTTLMLLLIVVFNLSALVKYITRFTEESFACLIALIFIIGAFKNVSEIATHADCECFVKNCNDSFPNVTGAVINCSDPINVTLDTDREECLKLGGTMIGDGCDSGIFYLSTILFVGTFFIAYVLVDFKTYTLFPAFVRRLISDFAVLIAILAMVVADIIIGINTPKLIVPDKFVPTKKEARGSPPLSLTGKENKLRKGVGYHLDLLVLAVCVAVHSFLGLPWYVAATVSALAHINSLKRESECNAPGEKPTFLGVREQRVTALAIGVLSGLAILFTSILKYIPMPVLYGVFLFMGVSALRGMQLIDRLYLFLQPVKYQPDLVYLRHVPLKRVHIFTVIQTLCLGALYAVKSVKIISIAFPIMVLVTGVVRKLLELIFPLEDLKWLDQLLPGKPLGRKSKSYSTTDSELLSLNTSVSFKETDNGKAPFSSIAEDSPTGDGKKNPAFFLSDETELIDGKAMREKGRNITKI
ncbi:hypothetical protein ScPMuIL_016116, partial [Solemya velum]